MAEIWVKLDPPLDSKENKEMKENGVTKETDPHMAEKLTRWK